MMSDTVTIFILGDICPEWGFSNIKPQDIKLLQELAQFRPMLFGWNRYFNKLNRMTHGKVAGSLTNPMARKNAMNLLRCDAHREVLTTILEAEFPE